MHVFEAIPNVSEGRDAGTIRACADTIEAAGVLLAHRTSDAVHDRSVFTYFGSRDAVLAASVALARVAAERIDLRVRRGAHPRIGALDVLPFVPFGDATIDDAVELARTAANAIWDAVRVPTYFYGDAATRPEHRMLASVRVGEFEGLAGRADPPDVGDAPHAGAGAVAVGARTALVAFNIVLATDDMRVARSIARRIRERDGGLRTLRALAIDLGDGRVQVSCNVTDVQATPLARVLELVRTLAAPAGVSIAGSELIGLWPRRAAEEAVSLAFGAEVRSREAQNSDA